MGQSAEESRGEFECATDGQGGQDGGCGQGVGVGWRRGAN